jgi:hypothetical protein
MLRVGDLCLIDGRTLCLVVCIDHTEPFIGYGPNVKVMIPQWEVEYWCTTDRLEIVPSDG